VGRGTALLQAVPPGRALNLLGPLGNPFDVRGRFRTAVVAAGGLGIAPVRFLAESLVAARKSLVLLWGVRTARELCGLDDFRRLGAQVHVATEDGSLGFHGRATGLLERLAAGWEARDARGFACGPMPMLRALQPLAAATGFPWQASLEERMACGVGACNGCVVRTRSRGYRTVCADGPVFDLSDLAFDD
jgi:dihydroorotate dehydrogenase electron transfer subunit